MINPASMFPLTLVIGLLAALRPTIAPAALELREVVLDGKTYHLATPAGRDHLEKTTPRIFIPAGTRKAIFHMDERNEPGQPQHRLRYKLEGHDTTWRDIDQDYGMRIMVGYVDDEMHPLGALTETHAGESPGWRGSPANSPFQPFAKSGVAPERTAAVRITLFSHGLLPLVGALAVDNIVLQIVTPTTLTTNRIRFAITSGIALDQPMGVPTGWIRQGKKGEIAQLAIRNSPTPHPVFYLYDADKEEFGVWASDGHQIRAQPGDEVTLRWEAAYSIGGFGPAVATYGPIPPGDYRFRIAAATPDGTLTGEEFWIPVKVYIPLYRQAWFWMLLGSIFCVMLSIGLLVFRNRHMRQKLKLLESQQAVEEERTRISRDLHDDIGAGLTEIAMQCGLIQQDLSAVTIPPKTNSRIARICEAAVDLTRKVDEIVWAVNPSNDTLYRFAHYLAQTTRQSLDAVEMPLRFEMPQEIPSLPMSGQIRHTLFLVVREALANAIKHAQATRIRVGIRLADQTLALCIEDNGRGIAVHPESPVGTQNGLRNMRLRMEEIGGGFTLTSQPGQFTRVEITLPFPKLKGVRHVFKQGSSNPHRDR